jgi:hypothetical protein
MGNGHPTTLLKLTLPEEALPIYARHPHPYRWYQSPNVVDLWKHRSQQDRARVTERIKVRLAVRW